MKPYVLMLLSFLVVPMSVFAQNLSGATTGAASFLRLLNILIPIAFSLALLFFFWGLAQFIYGLKNGTDAIAGGKRKLIWGTITLFVMASIWGLVGFFQGMFGIEGGGTMDVPGVQTPETEQPFLR